MSPNTKYVLKLVNYYVWGTVAYGFTRAVSYDFTGSHNYYNEKLRKFETKEMLFTDKLGTVAWKTFQAISAWPVMIVHDLNRLECAVTGKDLKEFSKRGANQL
jgi:hypothetical protein